MKPRKPTNPLKNQKGVALMMALFCLMLVMYFATELSYETNIEYLVNAQTVNRLKAHYAAESGVELSLLRIKIYKQAAEALSKGTGGKANLQMLDPIWNFPFAWPPILPEDTSAVDKDQIESIVSESKMDAQYIVTIEDEGAKIDINDLASESKALRESTKNQLLNIFLNKLQNDEEFAQKNRNLRYEELINNMIDWVDEDIQGLNGGDERAPYSDLQAEGIPPNRAFRTVGEVRMVAGMTDEIFAILEPRITVYGMRGINPNYANREVLMSIDPSITTEIADAIITRRNTPAEGGPFQDTNDFTDFVRSKGGNLPSSDSLPFVFDGVVNFRIKSTGLFSQATKEITAIVFDEIKTASRVAEYIKKEAPKDSAAAPTPTPKPGTPAKPASPADSSSNGRPQIVYWFER